MSHYLGPDSDPASIGGPESSATTTTRRSDVVVVLVEDPDNNQQCSPSEMKQFAQILQDREVPVTSRENNPHHNSWKGHIHTPKGEDQMHISPFLF